jgi:hypothetical protein
MALSSAGIRGSKQQPKEGTYDSCGLSNRLDYILISQSLRPDSSSGKIFRKGLWGSRVSRATAWETYLEMTKPTGEVIPTSPAISHEGKKYPQRTDYDFKRIPDQSHSTGHSVEPLKKSQKDD